MFAIPTMYLSKAPILFPSEFASPIQSTSEWYHQRRAEAGMIAPVEEPYISICTCDTCGIHVGPGHVYQSLYLYPVKKKMVYSESAGAYRYYEDAWLKVCEECAARRKIPETWCLLSPSCWRDPDQLFARQQDHRGGVPIDLIKGRSRLFTDALYQRYVLPKLTAFGIASLPSFPVSKKQQELPREQPVMHHPMRSTSVPTMAAHRSSFQVRMHRPLAFCK